MAAFCCPTCGEPLETQPSRYLCPRGHSFDRAREGYVNLLQSQKSRQARHGDDRAMVRARREFLEGDFYLPLSRALTRAAVSRAPAGPLTLLDAGCGEGWYTQRLWQALETAGHPCRVLGVDISKDALRYAARRMPQGEWAVASVFALPLADAACQLAVQVFAPLAAEEFRRVVAPGGALLRAVPLEKHLWELKEAVYPRPYENKPLPEDIDGFVLTDRQSLRYDITLERAQDIQNLFLMTPYYYKTSREDQARLAALTRLTTRVEFGLLTYERLTDSGDK